MNVEMKSLLKNKTWQLMEPPSTVRTLSAKWDPKLKRGKNREVTRYNTRLDQLEKSTVRPKELTTMRTLHML